MQESTPETLGTYQYFTRATPTRPLPCYLRRQSSGPEDVLLDMNNLVTEGSLGQVLEVLGIFAALTPPATEQDKQK